MGKTRKKRVLPLILLVSGLLVMGVSGYRIISQQLDYKKTDDMFKRLEGTYVSADSGAEGGEDGQPAAEKPEWVKSFKVDIEGLQKENPDCIGWIYQENGDRISYPVMYSGDDSSYLRTGFDKKYSTAGCVFVEGANKPDFSDSHTIVYGHNMRNLSMFGTLGNYHEKGFYGAHQYFQIRTADRALRYHIFAYSVVPANSFVYVVPYGPGEEFAGFISKLYDISEEDTGVVATDQDRIVTFSTCSTSGSSARRTVVHAVLEDVYEYR